MKYIKTFELQEDKSKIIKLNLSDRNLTKLPDLSEYISLKYLYCFNNNLTSLPELPKSLEILDCNNNKLTKLPELPNTLTTLYCDNNYLTSLPELPNTLEFLLCYNNNLTSLPELPKSLTTLICENNNLPYNNLDEYKEWILDPEAFKMKKDLLKYNI